MQINHVLINFLIKSKINLINKIYLLIKFYFNKDKILLNIKKYL